MCPLRRIFFSLTLEPARCFVLFAFFPNQHQIAGNNQFNPGMESSMIRAFIESEPPAGVCSISPESNQGGMRRGCRDDATNRKIERIIAYMTQQLDKPLPVARLAALANISPSHFFALFKRHTGCAPIDYFIRLRMRRACDLLGTTSLSVKEVAAVLGYDDQFYFSRVFKSVNGVAPSEYRALLGEMGRTERNVAAAPSEPEDSSPQEPGAELTENHGWTDRIPHEKHGSKQECLLR
jgi:AraC-like DNA-binding protein